MQAHRPCRANSAEGVVHGRVKARNGRRGPPSDSEENLEGEAEMYANNALRSPGSHIVAGTIALVIGPGPAVGQPSPPFDQNKLLNDPTIQIATDPHPGQPRGCIQSLAKVQKFAIILLIAEVGWELGF